MHTGPYNAGIESVWYLDDKQMPRGIKLILNTHRSLQCWYRISHLDDKPIQTGIKLILNTHWSLQCWYRINLVFR